MNALIETLFSYRTLSMDWDGYGGLPVNLRSLSDALSFIRTLPDNALIPSPMMSGSGLIGLYWSVMDSYTSLEFEGNGMYTLLMDDPAGYQCIEGAISSALPTNILNRIAK